MNTKDKLNSYTANIAMAQTATLTNIKVGCNFAKPIPRKVAENKKSFLQRLMKL